MSTLFFQLLTISAAVIKFPIHVVSWAIRSNDQATYCSNDANPHPASIGTIRNFPRKWRHPANRRLSASRPRVPGRNRLLRHLRSILDEDDYKTKTRVLDFSKEELMAMKGKLHQLVGYDTEMRGMKKLAGRCLTNRKYYRKKSCHGKN